MEETWVDRAKKRMKALGKTQEDLAGPLGVKTRSAVGHYFNGRRKLSADQTIVLAKELECSIDWLLTGKGPEELGSSGARLPKEVILLARAISKLSPERAKAALLLLDNTQGCFQKEPAHEKQSTESLPASPVIIENAQGPARPKSWGGKKKPGEKNGR